MVDFNNETTVGTPAADVERISILQRRYDVIEAIEAYNKDRLRGAGASLFIVKSRLFSLFLEIQATLKRRLSTTEYEKIKTGCTNAKTQEEIFDIVFAINEELDDIRLTRIDNQEPYDGADTEAENKIKGF